MDLILKVLNSIHFWRPLAIGCLLALILSKS